MTTATTTSTTNGNEAGGDNKDHEEPEPGRKWAKPRGRSRVAGKDFARSQIVFCETCNYNYGAHKFLGGRGVRTRACAAVTDPRRVSFVGAVAAVRERRAFVGRH